MLALLRQLCYYNKAFWNNISESRIADVAELADAHGSGPCESNFMQVQVLLPAPTAVSYVGTAVLYHIFGLFYGDFQNI